MSTAVPSIRPAKNQWALVGRAISNLFSQDGLRRLARSLDLDTELVFLRQSNKDQDIECLCERADLTSRWNDLLLAASMEQPADPTLLDVCCLLSGVSHPVWRGCVRGRLLGDALCVGFPEGLLEGLVHRLGKTLPDDLPRSPRERFARALAVWAEEEGWSFDLVREAYRAYLPHSHPDLRRYAGHFLPEGWEADLTAPSEGVVSDRAREACAHVGAAIDRQPALRAKIQACRPRLLAFARHSTDLCAIKELHDCLHGLATEYPAQLHELITDAGSPTAQAKLRRLRRRLKLEVLPELRRLAASGPSPEAHQDWIAELEQADAAWEESLKAPPDPDALDEVCEIIDRVAHRELDKVNVRLVDGARGFRIGDVLEALGEVERALGQAGCPPDVLAAVRQGSRDLADLDIRLRAMIGQHDQWQTIDRELQVTTVDVPHKARRGWSRLAARFEAVVPLSPAEWVTEYRACAAALDKALEVGDAGAAGEAFVDINQLARSQFLGVDDELKQFFGPLCEVGQSLATHLAV